MSFSLSRFPCSPERLLLAPALPFPLAETPCPFAPRVWPVDPVVLRPTGPSLPYHPQEVGEPLGPPVLRVYSEPWGKAALRDSVTQSKPKAEEELLLLRHIPPELPSPGFR